MSAAATAAPAATNKKPTKKQAVPKPAAKAPEPVQAEPIAEVMYPEVEVKKCFGEDAITVETAKIILAWETEKDRLARAGMENPGISKEALAAYEYGDVYMLKDEENANKVRCWNNLDNRPFDEAWSRGLAQTILNGNWAGPTTIPGETVNGSTIVIGRSGKVSSGQHSLTALILAHQMWSKNKDRHPFWADKVDADGKQTGPVLETIVIVGISEDPRVLMTVDNCKPRSEADVFYTSELFRTLLPADRKECSRMMAAAVDFLWKRTDTKGYKTHPEVMAFLDRHKKLLKCVEHVFGENSAKGGRKISNLHLSAGQASALCYLMGASETDGDVYRNGAPPSEKQIDWKRWDLAKKFWALLGGAAEMLPVRAALNKLVESDPDSEDNVGLGGRLPEKLAIIAKAWEIFRNGHPVVEGDVTLAYTTADDGRVMLHEDAADFGGIDVPERSTTGGQDGSTGDGPAPKTAEELEAEKEAARKARAEEAVAKLKALREGKDKRPAPAVPAIGGKS